MKQVEPAHGTLVIGVVAGRSLQARVRGRAQPLRNLLVGAHRGDAERAVIAALAAAAALVGDTVVAEDDERIGLPSARTLTR